MKVWEDLVDWIARKKRRESGLEKKGRKEELKKWLLEKINVTNGLLEYDSTKWFLLYIFSASSYVL